MAEQCAFYVRCDRCQYGRNLGSNEYGCRKHLAPDGKTIHRGQYSLLIGQTMMYGRSWGIMAVSRIRYINAETKGLVALVVQCRAEME